MKLTKVTIIMIAVVAIGIFALPTTLSVGTQQHKFRTAASTESNLTTFCAQCHGASDAVGIELTTSDHSVIYASQTGNGRIHATQWCGTCHAITGGYGVSKTNTAGTHAAEIPSCLKCHGVGAAPTLNDVTAELNDTQEAHKPFYNAGLAYNYNVGVSSGNDMSCIGCHTYVSKTGSITYAYSPGASFFGLQVGQ